MVSRVRRWVASGVSAALVVTVLGASPSWAKKPTPSPTAEVAAEEPLVELVSAPIPTLDGPVAPAPVSELTYPDAGSLVAPRSLSMAAADDALPAAGVAVSAPWTPSRLIAGEHLDVPVSVTNVTAAAWGAGQELRVDWLLPDGSPAPSAKPAMAVLPELAPGATGTVTVPLVAPGLGNGQGRTDLQVVWQVVEAGTSTAAGQTADGSVPAGVAQTVAVEMPTSDELGLESFFSFAGKNTGAGSSVMTNVASGNTVWSYDAFSNPGRGLTSFARFAYNSMDTSDTVTGVGWSAQLSGPIRLGARLDFHPNPHPAEVFLPDGDGTTHVFRLDEESGAWVAPSGVNYRLTAKPDVECSPNGKADVPDAWTMLRPDGTRFHFDCDGYLRTTVDKNGNTQAFSYEVRESGNRSVKFLTTVTDPAGRQVLSVDYYDKGSDEAWSFVDDAGQVVAGSGKLNNPKIYDHVRSISDVGVDGPARTMEFFYTDEGLLGQVVDGAGTDVAKTFRFGYEAEQGGKNVKLVTVTDPRGNSTGVSYYAPSSGGAPADHWKADTITDRLGGATTFTYAVNAADDQLRDGTVTDDQGKATTYVSDVRGRPRSVTNAAGETVKLTWDGDNNVTSLTEANGAVTAYCYDQATGNPLWQRDPIQNKALGLPTADTCKPGVTAATAPKGATVYEYQKRADGFSVNLVKTTSPAGRVNEFGYDERGNLTTVTDALGVATANAGDYTTTYSYDQYGQLAAVTDANEHTTVYSNFTATGFPRDIVYPQADTGSWIPVKTEYDERGRVLKVTDELGGWTSQTYDVFGRPLESVTLKDRDADDPTIETPAPVYDGNDNVVEATAPNGAVSTAVYDAADQMTSADGLEGSAGTPTTNYTYDTVGNLLQVTEPKGVAKVDDADYTTSYTYDDLYQLVAVTNAAGDRIEYDYDSVGNTIEVRDPKKVASDADDFTTRTEYDLLHRPVAVTDAEGNTTRTTFNVDGLVTATTDAEGNTATTKYDQRGAVIETKVPHDGAGESTVFRTTQFEYDEVGNTTRVITPRGVDTSNPDDFAIRTTYDARNRPVRQYQPYDPADPVYNKDNVYTQTTYDAAGRVTSTSMPASAGQSERVASTFEYFDNGQIAKSTDPHGITTTYAYNDLGQQTERQLTSANGTANRIMTWGFHADGALASMSDDGVPVGWHEAVTDDSDGSTTATGTWTTGNAAGQQGTTHRTHAATASPGADSFAWQLNAPTTGTYDLYVAYPGIEGAAQDATFTLSHGGKPAQPNGTPATAPTLETPIVVDQTQGGGAWHKVGSYELSEGEAATLTLAPSATGVVVADGVKLVRDNAADAATDTEQKTYTYAYDLNGNLTTITDPRKNDGKPAFTVGYDNLNQVTSVTETGVGETTYAYDANGLPLSVNHPKQTSAYTYDPRDLLASVTVKDLTGANQDEKTTSYTYTARALTATQTKANDNVVTFDYFLDTALKSSIEKKVDGTPVASHEYTYDANGNQATDTASKMNADDHGVYLDSTTTYTYDPVDRLATKVKTGNGASEETYVHDASANVTRQTIAGVTTEFTFDRNRLTTATTNGIVATYAYDEFGRQQSASAQGQIISRNTYDGFDHVIKSEQMNDAGVLEATTYTFDPLDRTTSTTTGGKTTDYTYLGLSTEVLTEEVAGELAKSYQYSPWGGRLSQISHTADQEEDVQAGETAYYGYNAHIDVETLTDDNGNTVATYGYTAYGSNDDAEFTGIDKPQAGDPTMAEPYNAYRYNAKRLKAGGSGTYDMGFRDYDPGLNQFTSRDMYNGALADMGLGADAYTGNRYAFGSGNPISGIEMDGHCLWDLCIAEVAGISIGVIEVAGLVTAAYAAYVASKEIAENPPVVTMPEIEMPDWSDDDSPEPQKTPAPQPQRPPLGSDQQTRSDNDCGWVNYGQLDASNGNRTTQMNACVDASMLDSGTAVRADPPGKAWARDFATQMGLNPNTSINSCHLLAKRLGGSGDLPNLATCSRGVNAMSLADTGVADLGSAYAPNHMAYWESQVYGAAASGQNVRYTVTPLYAGGRTVPYAFNLTASGTYESTGAPGLQITGVTIWNRLRGQNLGLQ